METKIGQTVKDLVTGVEGVAICRAQYLHGCIRLEVQPSKKKDDTIPESVMIDEVQIKIINKKQLIKVKKSKQLVKLGQKVYDPVSDLQGIVVARSVYMNGCSRVYLAFKKDHNGKYQDGRWIDEPQVRIVKEKRAVKQGSRLTGGPCLKPIREF